MKFYLLAFIFLSTTVFAQRRPLETKDLAQIVEILNQNDSLFNAFLKKDGAGVDKNAKVLQQLVQKSQVSVLKLVKAQAGQLGSIKSTQTSEANLKAYELFLNPLIKVVQEYNVGKKFNIYSCPMVKKSWIQNIEVNKDVKNVYAMYMLDCGTQDTNF